MDGAFNRGRLAPMISNLNEQVVPTMGYLDQKLGTISPNIPEVNQQR
jgi:hypothetical protein